MDIQIKIAVVIIGKDDTILLIKERKNKDSLYLWNTIKGTYENVDETLTEVAVRECQEEIGVKVNIIHALGTFISQNKHKIRIQFNFVASIEHGTPKISPSAEQEKRKEYITEWRWFDEKEIVNMRPDEFISHRSYQLVQDFYSEKRYPLDIFKHTAL